MWTYYIATIRFLPLGKGAVILMLGGFLMLMITLLWSLMMPRPGPVGTGPRQVATGRAPPRAMFGPGGGAVATRPVARPRWLVSVDTAARRARLGHVEVVGSSAGRPRLRLTECQSCRGRGSIEGCTAERDVIGRAVVVTEPEATVVEVSCRAHDGETCVFEVRTGAEA